MAFNGAYVHEWTSTAWWYFKLTDDDHKNKVSRIYSPNKKLIEVSHYSNAFFFYTDSKTTDRAYTIDTPNNQFSPQGWDAFDTNSTYALAGFYNTTPPVDPLSPNVEAFTFDNKFVGFPEMDKENKTQFQERFLDISSLPVVIEELVSERVPEAGAWPATEQVAWTNTLNTKTYNSHTMPFIDEEDNPDMKYGSVIPREVENNEVVISEYVVRDYGDSKGEYEPGVQRRTGKLTVDVAARSLNWPNDVISTPEVLSYVEQLEKEKCSHIMVSYDYEVD